MAPTELVLIFPASFELLTVGSYEAGYNLFFVLNTFILAIIFLDFNSLREAYRF